MANLPPTPSNPPIGPPYTFLMALNSCGLTTENQYQAFATEAFMDDFESYKDMSNEDLAGCFKTLPGLTLGQGQLRLNPQQKSKIKAFTQWVKDQFRLGIDPTGLLFPDTHTKELMIRAKKHQLFVSKSDTISKATKPVRLTKQLKCEDWAPTFINYVRAIIGRDSVRLKYIIRANDLPDLTPKKDFIENYVNNSILVVEAFAIDASEVHTFIFNLIAHNEETESVIKVHEDERDRVKYWKALKYHYEGISVYSNDITKADLNLRTITYTREKKPTMWWIDFERRLCLSYQTCIKHE